ncbi:VENN motif pre-toxin domain-containing protein, partial [Avibacterium paragallinarum]
LQSAVQQDKAGAITALASPYLNREIHKLTEGDSTKEKAANLMAHALLSAVEFQVTGKDPLTGAMAGVTGEATAQYLTKALYNKAPSELTANEKETISSLSQLAGGLAGAFTAKASGSSESQGGSFLSGVAGAETAKRAVENNFFGTILATPPTDLQAVAEGNVVKESTEQGVQEYIKKEHPAIYRTVEGTYYVLSKTGKAIYISRELVLQVAPMLLAPEIAVGTKVYGVLSRAAISGGANLAAQKISGQEFNFYEFAGAVASGTASPLFKTTAEAMRFNAGVGMATGIANGGDGVSDAGLAAGATYVSSKISNPLLSIIASETIQKFPNAIKIENKEEK